MTPVVAVEVSSASPADPRKLAALLRACSQALPEGTCESALGRPLATGLSAVARVVWDAAGNAVVTVHLQDGQQDLTRELGFAPVDPELQRWRSVGLAIATIVDELQTRRAIELAGPAAGAQNGPEGSAKSTLDSRSPVAPAKRTPASPRGPNPSGAQAVPRQSRVRFPSASRLELGASAATGLTRGVPRGGVYARAAHDLAHLPAFAQLRIAYLLSSSSEPPSVAWTRLGLGGGVYGTTRSLRLEATGELQMVRTSASAKSPEGGAIDAAASWLPGALVTIGAVWPAKGPVAAALTAEGGWVAREVVVTNAGAEIGRVPTYSVGFSVGVRVIL